MRNDPLRTLLELRSEVSTTRITEPVKVEGSGLLCKPKKFFTSTL